MRYKMFISGILSAIILLTLMLPACTPPEPADGYTAVIPAVLPAGSQQAVSVTLFKGDQTITGPVKLTLFKGDKDILSVKRDIRGKGTIRFAVPDIAQGEYGVRIEGNDFKDEAAVRIESNFLVFLESDKPIYKPGQTIQMRVFTLDAELKPLTGGVTVEVLDAKGIKVFRQATTTDDYGMAALSLPLSSEPNLGVWKLTAITPNGKTELDVRVEEYVLPKYEVKLDLPKEWFLAGEEITGKVTAEYSFGKPVSGDLEIKASRYVGVWEEYATYEAVIDGQGEFTIPPAGFVAGVPASGGQGNVMLEASVLEKATGYEEKTSALLTVAESGLIIKIIPSGNYFKPGLPFGWLVVTETPDNQLVDKDLAVSISYHDNEFREFDTEQQDVRTVNGKAMLEITPPDDAAALLIRCSAADALAEKAIEASYSPTGNFIHVEQTSQGTPGLGELVSFKVYSTREAANFYYEVVARGKVVFTGYTTNSQIGFPATPLMASSSKLIVYQILPSSEVAADYIPFNVEADYPQQVKVEFDKAEARPGDEVEINIDAEGESKVGIAAVDRSVFILAENRLNLQQVFAELEKLYMAPQAELHEVNIYLDIANPGAEDVFRQAGVIMLTNKRLPEGKEYKREIPPPMWERGALDKGLVVPAATTTAPPPVIVTLAAPPIAHGPGEDQAGLAEVQRVRQFFPETWLWQDVLTDGDGQASLKVEVPDTITTWMLRAVAMSKESGLGVGEAELKTFQPFFLTVDLPYSAIRGEEFPVRVAVYNYLDLPQSVQVEIEAADWFDLLDEPVQTIDIAASDIGAAEFMIRPTGLGTKGVKITARSTEAADAVIKDLIIEPEGVAREIVANLALSSGVSDTVTTAIPPDAIDGSGRAYLTLTASYLTQTIDGLEQLIQMPFGCGEQNMIVFAPDVFITKYLEASGQVKPEVMAKAEMLMLTGYQREMTYRHGDGSFSAFGEEDEQGSLWLTAFVLKSFAQADGLIYIDPEVLDEAAAWITSHQNRDGSFDPVGFLHHQEMMGGLSGKDSLTAYAAIALMQAGENAAAGRAIAYLETRLDAIEDDYTTALVAYALELGDSPMKDKAYDKLMALAQEDEDGLHWGDDIGPLPLEEKPGPGFAPAPIRYPEPGQPTVAIENTGYAALALIAHGDMLNAGRAAKWLVSKRNAFGGFGSTQDTVVALEALTEYGSGSRADVDLKVEVQTGDGTKELRITQDNYDVLQVVALPVGDTVKITASGEGEAIAQVVKRFNLPAAENTEEEILKINVAYDAAEVAVNDLINVGVHVSFDPPVPMEAGMTVLDISIPTGFTAVTESVEAVVAKEPKMKRYDIAGRKVIFYIENLLPGDTIDFSFQARAMYPVRAKGVSSKAYAYYQPDISGETLSSGIVVK
jgi:CD109 antigen